MIKELNVKLTEEAINNLVESTVKEQLEKRLSNDRVLDNAILNVISIELRNSVNLKEKIHSVIESMKDTEDSALHRILKKEIANWFELHKNTITIQMKSILSDILTSREVFNTYVEPIVSKAIVADESFIPYVKNEVSNRLNEKIKNISKSIGDTISTPVVKDFLKQYMTNRFKDDHIS